MKDVMTAKVLQKIETLVPNVENIDCQTILLGDGAILDSMKLVQLCVELEDVASEYGFVFDWTSGNAMSRSTSIFNTVGTLTDELLLQLESKK